MALYTIGFQDIDKTKVSIVGGKGANLGELMRIKGIKVPEGFGISTEAFKRIVEETPGINDLLDQLALLKVNNQDRLRELSAEIRSAIENTPIPHDICEEIYQFIARFGEEDAYAVRSSATAEDLPTASFAGQQDTYLNVTGKSSILKHVSKCWASLFTDRAIAYRLQNGFDHRKVRLSVVVQKMVFPQASGILFTADPVNGNRKVLSIDAGFGLGEAMVSGLVNADNYRTINGEIINKKVSTKKLAVYASDTGSTEEKEIEFEQQSKQVLTDEQILQLESLGRKIEEQFGSPQDIEWCLANDVVYIVQSRPITTLYPIPKADDHENRVYVSVGHQQMMTDAFKPLGLSVWKLTGNGALFKTAGGRLFVDITNSLASPAGRENLLNVLGHSDPLIKDALMTIIDRGFVKENADSRMLGQVKGHQGMSAADILAEAGNDPEIVTDLIRSSERSISVLKDNIQHKTGLDAFNCILNDMQQRRQLASELKNLNVIMAGIHASAWINEKMNEWLGEQNVADTLSLSVPNNITSEMGIQLLDVADLIRPYPEITNYLQQTKKENFLDELGQFEGGQEVRDAIVTYLARYGMRCSGEIDITRTRWTEKPSILLPMLLSNIKNLEPGESKRRFEQGLREALKKEQDLLTRLMQLPDGELKAEETKQMIDLIRNFIGYREYPKYDIVSRYFIYKQALLKEAERLVQTGVLHEKEDSYYLTFEELQDVLRTNLPNYEIINRRKDEYKLFEKLTPPRVITSDGEVVTGQYKRGNIAVNAIVGLAVSSGTAEGRARVVLNIEEADLEDGDILVTIFTDPSWTPLFLSIKGLVTEVGGLMTHGAVVAREYGLPAVVGLENATKRIKDGQRIRVHGTEGYVEIIEH
jgi:phosphoenolpyruvate synthase/pyruvate phosphate dikinase